MYSRSHNGRQVDCLLKGKLLKYSRSVQLQLVLPGHIKAITVSGHRGCSQASIPRKNHTRLHRTGVTKTTMTHQHRRTFLHLHHITSRRSFANRIALHTTVVMLNLNTQQGRRSSTCQLAFLYHAAFAQRHAAFAQRHDIAASSNKQGHSTMQLQVGIESSEDGNPLGTHMGRVLYFCRCETLPACNTVHVAT